MVKLILRLVLIRMSLKYAMGPFKMPWSRLYSLYSIYTVSVSSTSLLKVEVQTVNFFVKCIFLLFLGLSSCAFRQTFLGLIYIFEEES